MLKQNIPAILAFIFCIAVSCKKNKTGPEGPAGPTGPAGPAYKGVVNGHVSIFDQYGSQVLTGLADVQVTLKGGATKNADANGYYFFDSVATGTHNIQATGTGLGATVINNVPFIKDTFYQEIKMSKKPDYDLTAFNAYHNTGSAYDSLVVAFPTDAIGRARNWIVFVGNSPAVSSSNYLLSYVRPIQASAFVTVGTFRIPAQDLNNVGLFFGQTAYFAAYSYVVNDVSVYRDVSTGKYVYNAVGAPLTSSAIVP